MNRIPVNDGWWIEKKKAWFLSADESELYEVDLIYYEYRLISKVPLCEPRWRSNNTCFKVHDFLYCLPDTGDSIWIYDIKKDSWKKKIVKNDDNVRLCLIYCAKRGREVYLYSPAQKTILVFDTEKDSITDYISLVEDNNTCVGRIFLNEDSLYIMIEDGRRIVSFDYLSGRKEIRTNSTELPKGDYAFAINNKMCWMAGTDKYIYSLKNGSESIIKYQLSGEFGEYSFFINGEKINQEEIIDTKLKKYEHPAFLKCIKISGCVWLIPFYANKIIYIDITENNIKELCIKEEEENSKSLKNRVLPHKYLYQYVRENRYLGLFSAKNEWVIEIDTVTKDYRILHMHPNESTLSYLKKKYKGIFGYECEGYKIGDFMDELVCPVNKFAAQILENV